jgi:hypothetical protein
MAAARTIFLWLCCHRLHARLAQLTSRQQQCEAALACLQYEQECCAHGVLAEEQRQQGATAQAKALANKANKRRHHKTATLAKVALAKEQHPQELGERYLFAGEFGQLMGTFAAKFGQLMVTFNSLTVAWLADSVALADLATLTEMALAKE